MVDLPISEESAYLSVRDVAALFNISTKTVHRWIKSGTLPATRLGRDWRVARSDLHALDDKTHRLGGPRSLRPKRAITTPRSDRGIHQSLSRGIQPSYRVHSAG